MYMFKVPTIYKALQILQCGIWSYLLAYYFRDQECRPVFYLTNKKTI